MKPLDSLSDDWPAISALLDEALDLPMAARAAWLDELTGERAARRESLRALLGQQAEIESRDFLGALPPIDGDIPDQDAPGLHASDSVVGGYRLLSEIGRGGMSTVWLAERSDRSMQRKVALKLPRAAWGVDFAERLARERVILESLEHEHIARLYDAGLDQQGRPYLAMEFVEGVPIDGYCREHAVTLRRRIDLVVQVAEAVSHAHSRLVVHRDLKPANILVTGAGQVKLLDFGIAKLLEGDRTQRTALTELAGRALTLDYASPEQIQGLPLGTTSDVYSLGVVAYELLANARPYQLRRGSAAEIEEAIANVDPRRASDASSDPQLRRQLRGDLDAILNKALKKSPDDRYQSVDAFAQDLERYLQGQPVQAQPDSRRYRVGKFVRRHRLAIGMSTALGVSVLAGIGVSLWQAREARAQATRAESEVEAQLAVRDLYRETLMQLSATAIKDPAALAKPHAIVGALSAELDDVESRYENRPAARDAQLDAVALQLNYDGDFEASLAVARRLLASLKAHGAGTDRILRAYGYVSSALFRLKRMDEAELVRREAVNWAPDDVDPATVAARSFLYKDLGSLLIGQGRREEAEQVLLAGDALVDRTFPKGEFTFVPLQLSSLYIGFDEAKALQYARKGHRFALMRAEADADQKGFERLTYGTALTVAGLTADAEAALNESLAFELELYEPANSGVMRVFSRLVGTVSRQGDFARATALLDRQRATLAALPGGVNRSWDNHLQARGAETAWLAGDITQVGTFRPPALDALFTGSMRSDNDSPFLAHAQLLGLAGQAREALALLESYRQQWPNPGQPTAMWLRLQIEMAIARLRVDEPAEARKITRDLRSLLEQQHATTGNAWRTTAELSAVAAARQGDLADARASLALADAVKPAPPFGSAVERAESSLRRAEVLTALGQSGEATAAGRAAWVDLKGQHPDSPRLTLARHFAETTGPMPSK